VVPPQKQKIST